MTMKVSMVQKGFVLVTSLVLLVVLSLLAILSIRTGLLEESMAANESDRTVALAYAEMALRDAERDILGLRFDGAYCRPDACKTLRPAGTRPTQNDPVWDDPNGYFGEAADGHRSKALEWQGLYSPDAAEQCGMPIWEGAHWEGEATARRRCAGSIGAPVPTVPYGRFTDATLEPPAGVLASQDIPPPRYLIEMIPLNHLDPSLSTRQRLFRITAMGFGRSVGPSGRTTVVLQTVFHPG